MTVAVSAFSVSGTNRNRSTARSSRCRVVGYGSHSVQVDPLSVEYCQVPLLLASAVTAIPSTGSVVHVADRGADDRRHQITGVVGVVFGDGGQRRRAAVVQHRRIVDSRDGDARRLGGRAEGRDAAVGAGVDLVAWSTAGLIPSAVGDRCRVGILAHPARTASRSVARSNRAELSATAPTSAQVDPLSVEYCQVPLLLSTAVTAIPSTAPASTSLIEAADDGRDQITSVVGVVFGDGGQCGSAAVVEHGRVVDIGDRDAGRVAGRAEGRRAAVGRWLSTLVPCVPLV